MATVKQQRKWWMSVDEMDTAVLCCKLQLLRILIDMMRAECRLDTVPGKTGCHLFRNNEV